MPKLSFRRYLESTDVGHPDDPHEEAIAHWVTKLVAAGVKAFFASGKKLRLSQAIVAAEPSAQVVNLGSQAMPEPAVQVRVPADLNGTRLPQHFIDKRITVRIRPARGRVGADAGAGIINVTVDVVPLENAAAISDPQVYAMLARLEYQLQHECGHLSSSPVGREALVPHNVYAAGGPKGPDYDAAKIAYYTDEGELRAHAKQFAALYARYHPGQPFDLQKMLALSPLSDKVERFFSGMVRTPRPGIWGMDTGPHADRLDVAGRRFMALFQYYLGRAQDLRART